MDKGIIKMVILVTIIAITLLVGSLCLAIKSGSLLMKSMNTSDQINQDNGTGTSDSSSTTNQKSMSKHK